MKRQLWLFLLIEIMAFPKVFGQAIFDYTFASSTDFYVELDNPTVLTDGVIWDEETYLLALGFTFYVGNEGFDTVAIHANGYLTFVNNTVNATHTAMIFGDVDLQDRGVGTVTAKSPISYQIDGSLGSQIVKIQYKNAGFFDGIPSDSVNFQVWIYENLDKIEYRFGQSSIANPLIVFQGNTGAICGLYTANANSFLTGFTLTNVAASPDTAQFANLELFNLPSLNSLIPENSVYTFAHNHPVATEFMASEPLAIHIFKNPTTDFSIINMVLPERTMIYLDVFDINGKRLKTEKIFSPQGECQIMVDLSKYPPSVYFCQIRINEQIFIEKLIKI